MSIKKYLIQKLLNPVYNNPDTKWINTMYITQDEDEPDSEPSIYWHGKLADERVISPANLENGMVTSVNITDNIPADNSPGELIITVESRD